MTMETNPWRINYIASIVLTSFVLYLVAGDPIDSEDFESKLNANSNQASRQLSLKDLFKFEIFESYFGRTYSSFIEKVVRQKIYLAHAVRVFISLIKYKQRIADVYLAINQFSDRTADEIKRIMISPLKFIHSEPNPGEADEYRLENSEGVSKEDIGDIEQEVEYSREHKNEPGYKETAEEPDKSSTREQRDVDLRQSSHLDDLLKSVGDIKRTVGPGMEEQRKDLNSTSFASQLLSFLPENFLTPIAGFLGSNFFNPASDIHVARSRTASTRSRTVEKISADEIQIDHRKSNCFFRPRDQGDCASCYAFAAISFYEWAHCMATGNLVAFSEQYIVDCGARFGRDSLDGCNGGKFTIVNEFVDKFGLELQENYPYIEREYQCPYARGEDSKKIGYMRISSSQWSDFSKDEIDKKLKHSPVLINMKINRSFAEYGGGIDLGSSCRVAEGVHSALIVGSGKQDDKEYWLVRNSFSSGWGEQGYYKLNKRTKCIFPSYGFTLKPKFNKEFKKNINQNYDGREIKKRREQYVEIERDLLMKIFKRDGKTKRRFKR